MLVKTLYKFDYPHGSDVINIEGILIIRSKKDEDNGNTHMVIIYNDGRKETIVVDTKQADTFIDYVIEINTTYVEEFMGEEE